jgi:hypothetical protein
VSDYPDIVGNIRIDQSWGTWLVGAAAGRVGGQYWGVPGNGNGMNTGGPDSKIGWAVTTGFILNLPMIAPGDRLSAGIVYTEGRLGYASVTPSGAFLNKFEGNSFGFGFWEDGIYQGGAAAGACGLVAGNNGGCGAIQLTTAWSASAAFEHLWTPSLRTSWYGSYVSVSHNDTAKNLICNSAGTGSAFQAGNILTTGCDPDWSSWNVGSRTQWEPVKGLIMGVDVIYNKLNTAKSNFSGVVGLDPGAGSIPATSTGAGACVASAPGPCYVNKDMDAWTGTFRIQRDFLP